MLQDASGEDTVRSLKNRIQFWEGVPIENQRLMFHGQLLDDNRPLKHYNIPKGGVVHLNPDKMGIYVRNPDGNTMLVEVDPSDTVMQFKSKLSKISGIDPTAQNLLFGGRNLDNNATLGEYDMPEDSVVYLNPAAVKLQVTLPSGKVTEVEVLPSDTVETLKRKLHKVEGVPPEFQRLTMPSQPTMGPLRGAKTVGEYPLQDGAAVTLTEATPLYVKKADGSTVAVDFDPTVGDVAQLKEKIAELTGLPAEQQRLVYQGRPLNDDRAKVSRYKVPKNGVVELNPNSVPVQVHTADGKTVTLEVNPLATIRNVKDLLSFWEGIPPEEQRINLTGKKWKRPLWDQGAGLDGDRTLASVGIGKNGDLDLSNSDPLRVVLPDGRVVFVDTRPTNTLAEIKRKLVSVTGVDPSKQTLVGIAGKPLADSKSLAQQEIPIGGTLYLNPVQGNLKVQDLSSGKTYAVPTYAYDTVADLKARLAPLSGVPSEEQTLFVNGEDMGGSSDALPLSEFGVDPKTSTVYLNPVAGGKMNVKTPTGQTVAVDVTPADTVGQLKKRLATLTG
jgi:ubiquitin C